MSRCCQLLCALPLGLQTHTRACDHFRCGRQLIAHGSRVATIDVLTLSRLVWVVLTQGLHAMQVHHGIAQACHSVSLQMTGIMAYSSQRKGSLCAGVSHHLMLAQLPCIENHASDAGYLVQSSLQVSQPCLASV